MRFLFSHWFSAGIKVMTSTEFEKEVKRSLPLDYIIRFKTLEWVFDPIGNRGQGRSYLLACTFLFLALKYPGKKIYYRDHSNSRSVLQVLIKNLVQEHKLPIRVDGNYIVKENFSYNTVWTTGKGTISLKGGSGTITNGPTTGLLTH